MIRRSANLPCEIYHSASPAFDKLANANATMVNFDRSQRHFKDVEGQR